MKTDVLYEVVVYCQNDQEANLAEAVIEYCGALAYKNDEDNVVRAEHLNWCEKAEILKRLDQITA